MSHPDDDELLARLESYADRLGSGATRNPPSDAQPTDSNADGALAAGQDLLRLIDRVRRQSATSALSPDLHNDAERPARFGRFEIVREIGRGGFGIVYQAHDPSLNRSVALKIPRGELFHDEEKQRRFLGEAETAAALNHPYIVPIYEAGTIGAMAYIVSAYCPGPDLAEWLASAPAPPPWAEAANLVRKLALAVHAAHQRGIVHRDLKPSNVLLAPIPDGPTPQSSLSAYEPRLTDFGLAKFVESDFRQTRTSLVVGTPLYMAPELLERSREPLGPAVDVYSLGVILFELIAGRPPIEGSTYVEVADQIRNGAPTPLRSLCPECPRDLEIVCRRCVEKAPQLRYAAAADLASDLQAVVDGEPIQSMARRPLARLLYWSRRPQRIRQAAFYSLGLHACMTLWTTFNMSMLPFYDLFAPDKMLRTVREAAIVTALVPGIMTLVNWQVLRGKPWAVVAGFCLSAIHVITPLSLMTDQALFGEAYEGADFYALNTFSMIFLGFVAQLALYTCALLASRARASKASSVNGAQQAQTGATSAPRPMSSFK